MAQESHSPVLVFDSPVMVLHSPVFIFIQSSLILNSLVLFFLHSPVLFLHGQYTVQFYFLCSYQTSLALL